MFKKLNMEIGTKLSLGGNKLDNNLKSSGYKAPHPCTYLLGCSVYIVWNYLKGKVICLFIKLKVGANLGTESTHTYIAQYAKTKQLTRSPTFAGTTQSK